MLQPTWILNKETLGTIAALLAVVSNSIYFILAWQRKIRPHVFSWTIWGLITAITFFAQVSADAGPGAWHIAVNSVCCFSIAALAMAHGNYDIKRSDVIAFVCALMAILLWYLTHDPLAAVITVVLVEIFAYYPTFRKSYSKPREEMASEYAIDSVRAAISIPALQTYSATTLLYPIFAIVVNVTLVAMLMRQRFREKLKQ